MIWVASVNGKLVKALDDNQGIYWVEETVEANRLSTRKRWDINTSLSVQAGGVLTHLTS